MAGAMQVAVQLALLIAKIARFDYPREWYGIILISFSVVLDLVVALKQCVFAFVFPSN